MATITAHNTLRSGCIRLRRLSTSVLWEGRLHYQLSTAETKTPHYLSKSAVQFTTAVIGGEDAGTLIRKRCPSEVTS